MYLFHFIAENKITSNFSTSDIINSIINKHLQREVKVEKDSKGKPIVVGCDDVFISVTHSNNHAVLAISDKRVGVDLELIKDFNYSKIVKRFFSEKEDDYILNNGLKGFFEIWTRKEARIKCFDSKLSDCVFDNQCFEKSLGLDDYILSVCSDKEFIIKDISNIHI